MTLAELLVKEEDAIRPRQRRIATNIYDSYAQSLSNYISWMKEQISKSKDGRIRIRRGDLARAIQKELRTMGYREENFNNLYKMIRFVLFNKGLFVDLSRCEREHVFLIRNRTENDYLIPGLLKFEKKLEKEVNYHVQTVTNSDSTMRASPL